MSMLENEMEKQLDSYFYKVYNGGDFDIAKRINDMRYEFFYELYTEACKRRRKISSQNLIMKILYRRRNRKELDRLEKDIEQYKLKLFVYNEVNEQLLSNIFHQKNEREEA